MKIWYEERVIFEPVDDAELREWIRMNAHRWNPTSTPYIELESGKRFEVSRANRGLCTCTGCLASNIPIPEAEKHLCVPWWEKDGETP